MTRGNLFRGIERGLLLVGVVLAAWCAVVIVQARRTRNMPIPAAPAVATLPGEAPDTKATTRRPPTPVAPGTWLARLDAPSIHLTATVLEGSDDGTLRRGAGHIEDTAFPGDPGNVGIAGHRDTTFRPVRRIKVGDPLVLTTADRVYRYRVTKAFIVGPDDVAVLDPAGHPTLTLVTCYPFEFIGHAPNRFIVSADLVETKERPAP